MGALLLRLRSWWETADRTQRVVTLFGGSFLAILLFGAFYFSSRPKMALLYGGLPPSEAGQIVSEIQKMGIPVDQDVQGNVFVPSNKLAEAQSKIAMAGKTPSSGHMGNEDLAKLGMMSTPTVERERIKTILEGEIAKSIEAIEGIASARVHITLGERSPFAGETRPATASVYVREKGQGFIGGEQARAIGMLVARATPNMDVSNVFVVDSSGRTLYDGANAKGVGSQANEKLAAEIAEAQRRERDLQGALDSVFGAGNTVVKVNLAMNFDRETAEQKTVTPNKNPISSQIATEVVGGKGADASNGGAGTGPNMPGGAGAGTTPAPGSQDYKGEKSSTEYAYSTNEKRTEKAVGEITRMSVAVLASKTKEADVAAMQTFLDSTLAAFPGAKGTVTVAEFDTTRIEDVKKSEAAAKQSDQMQQIFSLLPIAALVIVSFIVIKAITKTAKSTTVQVTALPGGQYVSSGGSLVMGPQGGAMALGGGGSHAAHEMAAGMRESNGTGSNLVFVEDDNETAEIRAIKERLNAPLEAIKKMSTDRPEAVAMLLKSWMLEERR